MRLSVGVECEVLNKWTLWRPRARHPVLRSIVLRLDHRKHEWEIEVCCKSSWSLQISLYFSNFSSRCLFSFSDWTSSSSEQSGSSNAALRWAFCYWKFLRWRRILLDRIDFPFSVYILARVSSHVSLFLAVLGSGDHLDRSIKTSSGGKRHLVRRPEGPWSSFGRGVVWDFNCFRLRLRIHFFHNHDWNDQLRAPSSAK